MEDVLCVRKAADRALRTLGWCGTVTKAVPQEHVRTFPGTRPAVSSRSILLECALVKMCATLAEVHPRAGIAHVSLTISSITVHRQPGVRVQCICSDIPLYALNHKQLPRHINCAGRLHEG